MITDEQVKAAYKAYSKAIFIPEYITKQTYKEAMRDALEAADAKAWKKIEDAPTDRTEILAYAFDQDHGKDRVGVAIYVGPNRCPECVGFWHWPWAISPTHFRPLPTPPKEPT